ncbi:MAG: hypothetical protein NT049_17620, partial [Planctomycetota bacterium]|nr:hypothetical protein [Planctomycetota bacterium]
DSIQSRRLALLKRIGLFGHDTTQTQIARANTVDDLRQAYRLVHDIYVEEKYILPRPCGLRMRVYEALPETATVVAKNSGRVVGLQSLVVDSLDLGLPCEKVFPEDVNNLRIDGHLLCEATNKVVAHQFRRGPVPTELMRALYAHATHIDCRYLLAVISPGHAMFYSMLGFEQIGSQRSYSAEINDPVVLACMDLQKVADRMNRVSQGEERDDAWQFITQYYRDENPYRRLIPQWMAETKNLFADADRLRELFLVHGGLLDQCTAEELQIIQERWQREDEDLYAEVFRDVAIAAA